VVLLWPQGGRLFWSGISTYLAPIVMCTRKGTGPERDCRHGTLLCSRGRWLNPNPRIRWAIGPLRDGGEGVVITSSRCPRAARRVRRPVTPSPWSSLHPPPPKSGVPYSRAARASPVSSHGCTMVTARHARSQMAAVHPATSRGRSQPPRWEM